MHLITQPVHVLPCGTSAVKGNNGANIILYHDIAAPTITGPPLASMLELGFPYVGFLMCSPNVNSSCCWEQREGPPI
jgi:hypothetical protein